MKWKEVLKKLESLQEWDMAIAHMQEVLEKNPDNLDAYLSMLYLVMNLIVEEDYDRSKHSYYAGLCKKYFDESYQKFNQNPEYLYYVGRIGAMSEWYFNIEIEDCQAMIDKSLELNSQNLIYQWPYYSKLSKKNLQDKDLYIYIILVLNPESIIQKELRAKGSLGEYILDMMEYWAEETIDKIKDKNNKKAMI